MPYLHTRTILAASIIAALAASPGARATPLGVTLVGAPAPQAPTAQPVRATTTTPPTPVFDTDEAARNAFQASVSLSVSTPSVTITIPTGKRLVVEHIAAVAYAYSSSGPIQPLVVAYASHGGGPSADFEYVMSPYALLANQFSLAQQMMIYADKLTIGFGYAGYTPATLDESVTLTGHLVTITPPQ
jgi:hypothetical protein